MSDVALPGYLSFPKAAHLCASIIHPGETVTNGLFDELAGRLRQELQVGQLRAHLLVRPRGVPPSRRSKAPGYDDGKRFEIAAHYWATENAFDAIHDRWVEAPVLEPLPPSAYRQVNKGGYVLLEEKAICELIAIKDPADKRASTADVFEETYWSIPQALCWAATRSAEAMARYFTHAPGQALADVHYAGDFSGLFTSIKQHYSPVLAKLEDIEGAARLGRIVIEGKEDGRSPWRAIPADNWGGGSYQGGLALGQRNHNGGIEAADPVDPSSNRKVWTHLRVKREEMLRAFRADEDADRAGDIDSCSAATQPLEQDQWQEPAANPMHKQDPNPAPPRTLAEEVALVARDSKIIASMRLSEKINEIEAWFDGKGRTPPGRTTIRTGLKLAGLTNPRRPPASGGPV